MLTEAQREASVKFCDEIKPIELANGEVATKLKELFTSVLFGVKELNLSHRLRKDIEEIEGLLYTELKLITNTIRGHYNIKI